MNDSESRVEVYHNPKPWVKNAKPPGGFVYELVGEKPQERFYGVGCRSWWYQWNEPET